MEQHVETITFCQGILAQANKLNEGSRDHIDFIDFFQAIYDHTKSLMEASGCGDGVVNMTYTIPIKKK